ncbi:MAG: hypothetical protein ACYS47_04335 [Planctomycetota bacterium]|jgi:hypothetical protein
MSVAPSGILRPERLNRILTDLLNHRYIGVLTAEDAKSGKEFYFAGSGVKVTSVGPRKSLPIGRFWISAQAVTEEAVNAALENQRERGGLLGELLVDGGHMTDDARNAGLADKIVEELADVFFWPSPQYHYTPGHQTRVGGMDRTREKSGGKSLSLSTNVAQLIMRAKVDGQNLRRAGRTLGGIEVHFKAAPAAKEILFTKSKFMELPPWERLLLPHFRTPRNAGELIEGSGVPWSRILSGMVNFVKRKLIEPA